MANQRTLVIARELLFAWHSATCNGIFTSFSLSLSYHHKLISATVTCFLKLRSFFARTTRAFVAISFALVITALQELLTDLLASEEILNTINDVLVFSTIATY